MKKANYLSVLACLTRNDNWIYLATPGWLMCDASDHWIIIIGQIAEFCDYCLIKDNGSFLKLTISYFYQYHYNVDNFQYLSHEFIKYISAPLNYIELSDKLANNMEKYMQLNTIFAVCQ